MLPLVNLASSIIDRAAFSECSNNFARIEHLLNCPEFIALLHQSSSLLEEQTTNLKSSTTSSEYRDRGNEAYAQRNDRQALTFYNQAIRYAPAYSRELSLALGNRSAVLCTLKYYQLAINDIHRALDFLSSSDEDHVRRQRLEQRLDQCLRNRSSSEQTDEDEENCNRLEMELKQLQEDQNWNSKYSSLTLNADIQYADDRGRHVISANVSRTLKPGTIVLIEQPYASVLLSSAWSTHCHRCFRRLDLLLFACSQCIRAIYCSIECLQESIIWHAFECRLNLEHLDKMQMLAFRLLTKTGWHYLLKHQKNFEILMKQTDEENMRNNPIDVYKATDYEMILRLQTNSNKRTVDDLFQRSIQACVLGLSLINNTSFCQSAYDNLNYQIYICSLILSHLQSLPCNAHEISEFIYHRREPLTSSCLEIGAGIYATLSLFNHSCNPNVIRNFIGETVVVRLLSSISNDGEELTDNYGCLSATATKPERNEKLHQQYHFHCQCQPCVEQWPQYDQLPDDTGDKTTSTTLFNQAFQRLIKGERPKKDDLIIFEEFLARCDDLMQERKGYRSKIYNNAQEAYKQCLNFFAHSMHTED